MLISEKLTVKIIKRKENGKIWQKQTVTPKKRLKARKRWLRGLLAHTFVALLLYFPMHLSPTNRPTSNSRT